VEEIVGKITDAVHAIAVAARAAAATAAVPGHGSKHGWSRRW
jgi:hypothetical protein